MCLFLGFKFTDIYKSNEYSIRSKQQEFELLKIDKEKQDKTLLLVNGFNSEGKGDELNVSFPALTNALFREMPFYGISAQIVPDMDGNNVKVYPLEITNGKTQYIRFSIKGNYTSYEAFRKFINNLSLSGLSINKIHIFSKSNFDMTLDMVGY